MGYSNYRINGERQNENLEKIPVLETTWKTAKTYFPNAKVLKRNSTSRETGRVPQEPNDENDDNVELPFAGELTFGVVESDLNSVHFFRYSDFQSSKRKERQKKVTRCSKLIKKIYG